MPDDAHVGVTRVRGLFYGYDYFADTFRVRIQHPGDVKTLTEDALTFLSRCIRKGLMELQSPLTTYIYHPDPKSSEDTWLIRAIEHSAVELEVVGADLPAPGPVVVGWKRLVTPGCELLTLYPVCVLSNLPKPFRSGGDPCYYLEYIDGLWHANRMHREMIQPVFIGEKGLTPLVAEDVNNLIAMLEDHVKVDVFVDYRWHFLYDIKSRSWVLTARDGSTSV